MRHDQKAWNDVKTAGLTPELSSIEDYNRAYTTNLVVAESLLLSAGPFLTQPDQIRSLHRALFSGIAPWAGEFSQSQMCVGGRVGTPYARASREFDLMTTQVNELLQLVNGPSDHITLIRIVAFAHARFEAIHAFPDGNGRLGRLLADHALVIITGQCEKTPINREAYMSALKAAVDDHNLAPLSDLFAATYLGQREPLTFLPSPFRIPPFQTPEIAFDAELEQSRRERLDVITSVTPTTSLHWLRNARWARLTQLINGRPSKSHDTAKLRFEAVQQRELGIGEAIALLAEIAKTAPFRGRSIFAKPDHNGWIQFAYELVAPLIPIISSKPGWGTTLREYILDQFNGKDRTSAINAFFKLIAPAHEATIRPIPVNSSAEPKGTSEILAPPIPDVSMRRDAGDTSLRGLKPG